MKNLSQLLGLENRIASHDNILTVLVICCTCYIMLHLTGSGCVALVTLCFIQTRTVTSQRILMLVIPMMIFGSNDLGGELSQSDSLLTHALVGIPGIPWHTLDNKDVEKCSG